MTKTLGLILSVVALSSVQAFGKTPATRAPSKKDPEVVTDDSANDPNCIDTKNWPFTIVQRIDAHTYEMVAEGVPAPIRVILVTKKAVFSSPGHPLGLRVKETRESRELPLENGFSRRYGVYRECGLIPLPARVANAPGLAIRQRLKDVDKP